EPVPRALAGSGKLRLGLGEPGREGLVVQETQGRDVPALDALERFAAADRGPLAESPAADLREPGRLELETQLVEAGEARLVDLRHRREEAVQPVPGERRGVEGRDDEPTPGREDAPELGERARPVEMVEHEAHERTLEPAVPEGQILGAAELDPHSSTGDLARLREHLLRRIDAPDARPALCESRRKPTCPAADLEHAPPREIPLLEYDLLELAPVPVDRPEPVVARRQGAEVDPSTPSASGRQSARPGRSSLRWRAALPRARLRERAPSAERHRARSGGAPPRPRAPTGSPPTARSSESPPLP